MRLYHADGPEQDFESGEQKGGNAGSSGCSGDARNYSDLSVSLPKPYLSLTDRLRKVRQGPAGRSKRKGVKGSYFEISHAKGEDAAGSHVKQRVSKAVLQRKARITNGESMHKYIVETFSHPVLPHEQNQCNSNVEFSFLCLVREKGT